MLNELESYALVFLGPQTLRRNKRKWEWIGGGENWNELLDEMHSGSGRG